MSAFKLQGRFAVSQNVPFIALAETGKVTVHHGPNALRAALKSAVQLTRPSGIAMVTHGSHQVALCHNQETRTWRRPARPFRSVRCEVLPAAKATLHKRKRSRR